MSTDIIQFPLGSDGKLIRTFSSGALKLWFAVTLPLTIGTLLCAYVFRWREGLGAQKRRDKLHFDELDG